MGVERSDTSHSVEMPTRCAPLLCAILALAVALSLHGCYSGHCDAVRFSHKNGEARCEISETPAGSAAEVVCIEGCDYTGPLLHCSEDKIYTGDHHHSGVNMEMHEDHVFVDKAQPDKKFDRSELDVTCTEE